MLPANLTVPLLCLRVKAKGLQYKIPNLEFVKPLRVCPMSSKSISMRKAAHFPFIRRQLLAEVAAMHRLKNTNNGPFRLFA